MKQTKKYIAALKSGAKSGVWAGHGDHKIVFIFKFFRDFWIFLVKELEMAVLVKYHAPIKYRLTRGGIFQIGPPWLE